jgi:uncharacterized membrane protein YecN with MAPEG domain
MFLNINNDLQSSHQFTTIHGPTFQERKIDMTEIYLPVTFTFIGALAILLIPLTGWIGIPRGKLRILRGDGGNADLFKRIRIHGNLMENAPLFAMVLGAAELSGLGQPQLWLAVSTFLLGRVLHYVLYDSQLRGGAMLLTVLPGVVMGGWLLLRIWM